VLGDGETLTVGGKFGKHSLHNIPGLREPPPRFSITFEAKASTRMTRKKLGLSRNGSCIHRGGGPDLPGSLNDFIDTKKWEIQLSYELLLGDKDATLWKALLQMEE